MEERKKRKKGVARNAAGKHSAVEGGGGTGENAALGCGEPWGRGAERLPYPPCLLQGSLVLTLCHFWMLAKYETCSFPPQHFVWRHELYL